MGGALATLPGRCLSYQVLVASVIYVNVGSCQVLFEPSVLLHDGISVDFDLVQSLLHYFESAMQHFVFLSYVPYQLNVFLQL